MLEVRNLTAWYQRTQALFDVNFEVIEGTCMALVGTNGAGKTTTLRALLGLVETGGSVLIDGTPLQKLSTHARVRRHQISIVHEGRGLFSELSVRENILVGQPRESRDRLDEALDVFPVLKDRLKERASLLSGGQQQMVALSRAIVQRPRLLLLDEPSLGLAPSIVDEIYEYLSRLRQSGLTMLLVEQSLSRAALIADAATLIRTGYSVAHLEKPNTDELERLMTETMTSTTRSEGVPL